MIWHISLEKLSQGDKALSYGRWSDFGCIVTPAPCVYNFLVTIYKSKSIKLQIHDTYIFNVICILKILYLCFLEHHLHKLIWIGKHKICFYVDVGDINFVWFSIKFESLNKIMHIIMYDVCICQFKTG